MQVNIFPVLPCFNHDHLSCKWQKMQPKLRNLKDGANFRVSWTQDPVSLFSSQVFFLRIVSLSVQLSLVGARWPANPRMTSPGWSLVGERVGPLSLSRWLRLPQLGSWTQAPDDPSTRGMWYDDWRGLITYSVHATVWGEGYIPGPRSLSNECLEGETNIHHTLSYEIRNEYL